MSKWVKIGIASFAVVSVLVVTAVLISLPALAQDETPTTVDEMPLFPGRGVGPLGGAGLEAAAQMLGMTAEELKAELWAGTNLADIAKEKGVDLVALHEAVQAAVKSAQSEVIGTAIDNALQSGQITQENADWLREGLEKGYIPGFGFGRFGGRGGFRGERLLEAPPIP